MLVTKHDDRFVGLGSEFLTTDHEVVGSIPGTSTILNVGYVWNGVHPASWGQLRSYLIEK